MPDQIGFLFDAPLVEMPASQLPPPRPIEPQSLQVRELLQLPRAELIGTLRNIAATMPDDIDYDDLLQAVGFPLHAVTGAERSAAMDALLPPFGEYQAYQPEKGSVRFKRLYPCPGYEGIECHSSTVGGVLCARCLALEEEDLLNQA